MDLSEVVSQLNNAGLVVESPVLDKFTRCKVSDDKGGKQSGWYFIYEYQAKNGRFYYGGVFGNWKLHDEKGVKIQSDHVGLSTDEIAEIKKKQDAARRKQVQEKKSRQKEAAERAETIWSKLPDTGKSTYLDRKKIKAHGLRFSKGSIVVPVYKVGGVLTGLQFIQPDGSKKFLTGTEKQGCYHVIGANSEAEVCIVCEGYATAASIYEANGWPVYVAFDAGNLHHVTKQVRETNPNALIVIAGDDDRAKDKNKGREMAEKAAKAFRGLAVFPEFSGVPDGGSIH